MKCLFITQFLLCFSTLLFSQTINDLDKKKGFKDFTLGDEFAKWKSWVVLDKDEGNTRIYRYPSDYQTIFNTYPLSNILLSFTNSKLVEINLVLSKWDNGVKEDRKQSLQDYTNKFVDIANRFKVMFGAPTFTDGPISKVSGNEIFWTSKVAWNAKSTTLLITFLYAELKNTGVVSVQILDNKQLVKNYTEGF